MMTNNKFTTLAIFPVLLLSSMLSWFSTAAAEPALSVAPQRSYGAIDVIMYQTSW